MTTNPAPYTLETIRVADLPDVPVFDPVGLAAAIELRKQQEPPPVVVYRVTTKTSGRTTTRLDVYDGLKRIAAAKRTGAESIAAAVCRTRGDAERLRAKIQHRGGAVRYWLEETTAAPNP